MSSAAFFAAVGAGLVWLSRLAYREKSDTAATILGGLAFVSFWIAVLSLAGHLE